MVDFIKTLWQFNIELSILLIAVLLARLALRQTVKVYNAYLLWASIPIGLLIIKFVGQIEIEQPLSPTLNNVVQDYIMQPSNSFDGWSLLAWVWLLTTIVLILRLSKQHYDLRQKLSVFTLLENPTFKSSYPIIGVTSSNFSPAVYGFVSPKIYFPVSLVNELEPRQIALIIQHEEHHIQQGHLWLNLLWDISTCTLWFNPLIYLSRQRFRHDQELYCDYLVLNKSTQHDQQNYGHALLSTVSATHSLSLLCSWKAFHQLEERIMNIKTSTTKTRTAKLFLSSGIASVIALSSLYAVSAADQPSGNNEKNTSLQSSKQKNDDAKNHDSSQRAKIENGGDWLNHSVRDGNEKIVWKKDKLRYIEENGKRYIVDGDNTRAMTEPETKAFKDKINQTQKSSAPYRRGMINAAQNEKGLSEESATTMLGNINELIDDLNSQKRELEQYLAETN